MTKKNQSCGFRTSIGGQALIEGILMRGPKKQAIVCRTKDGLVEKVEDIKLDKEKHPILGWPFVRGCAIFLDSMYKGMQALTYSASLIPEDEQEEPDKLDKWISDHFPAEKAQKLIIVVAVVLGIALSLLLFIFLPTLIVGFIKPLTSSYVIRNLSEGVLKVVILLIYMKLCTRVSDVQRLFSYHGAEHKTIFCYEHGEELTVENVRKYKRFHPRCGTSFIFLTLAISILVYTLLPINSELFIEAFGVSKLIGDMLRVCCKIIFLPIVVGISYELIRIAGKYDNVLTKIISAPGLAIQRLTTKEPADEMIEVAIASMKPVLPENAEDAKW